MPLVKMKEYLDEHHIRYVSISHSPAFTAQQIAASAHIPGDLLAKVVMVKLDGKMTMVVLPASYNVDFDLLRESTGAGRVELATEAEFMNLFPNCEAGAMPPFGNLYGMDVLIADSFAEDEEIVFNACSHRELIKMSYRDYENLVKPKVLNISAHRH